METEKQVQDLILEWLGYQKKTFVWRQNSGARIGSYTSKKTGITKKHMFRASAPGASDILGIYRGFPLAIEVKKQGGKATDLQVKFLRDFALAGGISIIAHSLDEVIRSLEDVAGIDQKFEGIFISNL